MTPSPPHGARFLGDGRYELMAPIGDGSMGHVHVARHIALDRIVAIKLVSRASFVAQPDADARFRREARTTSRLRHKNTVHVLDFGHDPEHGHFLVMEYVNGETLEDLLAREGRRLEPRRAIAIAAQVLTALAEAHDEGVVHRDIKPTNIMLLPCLDDDGQPSEEVKVLDFGIATLRGDCLGESDVCGTPEYMSPEQIQGLPVDERSDVYAIGVVLYDMLTGQQPFSGATAEEVVRAHLVAQAVPLRQRAPHVSEALAAVVTQAMARSPEERPPSARALRAALLALPEATTTTHANETQAAGAGRRWHRGWLAAAVAVVSIGAALSGSSRGPEPSAAAANAPDTMGPPLLRPVRVANTVALVPAFHRSESLGPTPICSQPAALLALPPASAAEAVPLSDGWSAVRPGTPLATQAAPVARAASASAPRLEARDGRAMVVDLTVAGPLARALVSAALERARPALEACYASAARAAGATPTTTARVSLEVDSAGRARQVHVASFQLTGLARCVSAALERVRVAPAPPRSSVARFLLGFTRGTAR
ncbi:MAG: serine/threonine-protein kinase [Myxococcota bacterium]